MPPSAVSLFSLRQNPEIRLHHRQQQLQQKQQQEKQQRQWSSTSFQNGSEKDDPNALYREQMQELQAERESLFGSNEAPSAVDATTPTHNSNDQQGAKNEPSIQELLDNAEELGDEREAIYGFTDEDRGGWSNWGQGQTTHSSTFLQEIEQARDRHFNPPPPSLSQISQKSVSHYFEGHEHTDDDDEDYRNPIRDHDAHSMTLPKTKVYHSRSSNDFVGGSGGKVSNSTVQQQQAQPLTHLTDDGTSVHMVNVANKKVTDRVAVAETRVVFTTNVWKEMTKESTVDLVGPKGPILTTAKIAGIMAAKYVHVTSLSCCLTA